jgi:cytosine deaminase
MDRVLHNVRLDGRLRDVTIAGGAVVSVASPGGAGGPDAPHEDLAGLLVLPAMVEPHAHLDKAFTADEIANPDGNLVGAVAAWAAATEARRGERVAARAAAAVERLLVNGVTAVRTHVNVAGALGGEALQAVRRVRDEYAGLVDLQIVALPSHPITGPDGAGNRRWMEGALEAGVDLVGGAPHLDPDPGAATRYLVGLATAAGLPLDLHTDETLDASATGLSELARLVVDTGFALPVTASHCVSLGMLPPYRQARVAAQVAAAGIRVVTLPITNLALQGRDRPTATPRGLTAVGALRDAGVTVAAGGDNLQDPFNLVGRGDPLETASLLVTAAHQPPATAYAMVSNDARAVMGLPAAGPEEGAVADLVALAATTVREAVGDAPHARRVYRRGRLVASAIAQRTVHR